MAMNGATLGTAIATQLRVDGHITAAQEAVCAPYWQSVGTAIVAHLVGSMLITGIAGAGAGNVQIVTDAPATSHGAVT